VSDRVARSTSVKDDVRITIYGLGIAALLPDMNTYSSCRQFGSQEPMENAICLPMRFICPRLAKAQFTLNISPRVAFARIDGWPSATSLKENLEASV